MDPYAPLSVSEFRIWNGALSAQQVALDAASGPAQIVTNPGALLSVGVTANSQMSAGAIQQAAVIGNFANVTNVNLITYGGATLTSDNTNVLTVSPSGLVTAFAPGTANLIGSYGGLSATQAVTVAGFSTNVFTFNSFGDGFWAIINQGNSEPLTANFSAPARKLLPTAQPTSSSKCFTTFRTAPSGCASIPVGIASAPQTTRPCRAAEYRWLSSYRKSPRNYGIW